MLPPAASPMADKDFNESARAAPPKTPRNAHPQSHQPQRPPAPGHTAPPSATDPQPASKWSKIQIVTKQTGNLSV